MNKKEVVNMIKKIEPYRPLEEVSNEDYHIFKGFYHYAVRDRIP